MAEAADVSPAYVQKLERGQVGSPSPVRLRSIGEVLGIDSARMMAILGYVEVEAPQVETALAAKLADAALTQTEEQAVGAFIEHLVAQRKSE